MRYSLLDPYARNSHIQTRIAALPPRVNRETAAEIDRPCRVCGQCGNTQLSCTYFMTGGHNKPICLACLTPDNANPDEITTIRRYALTREFICFVPCRHASARGSYGANRRRQERRYDESMGHRKATFRRRPFTEADFYHEG
jgi:hypothetical protein